MSAASFSRVCLTAAVVALGLALGGCAKNTADDGLLSGATPAAGPGSVQEFAASVGDRVFFDSDSTELSAAAQATLDKQAAWLNRYGHYTFTIEGHADERGTREYNFALGAKPRRDDQAISRRQRRRRRPHEDDQLWQGAPGRGLRRHFLLVAEPPRGHGARRRAWELSAIRAPRRPNLRLTFGRPPAMLSASRGAGSRRRPLAPIRGLSS